MVVDATDPARREVAMAVGRAQDVIDRGSPVVRLRLPGGQPGLTDDVRDLAAAAANHRNAACHRLDQHPPELLALGGVLHAQLETGRGRARDLRTAQQSAQPAHDIRGLSEGET